MSISDNAAVSPAAPPPPGGIVARNVRRSFGDFEALREVTLTAPAGEVTALVGPNGAGKTTLLLILATLLAPDAGSVTIAGVDVSDNPRSVRAKLGWSPDVFGLYDNLTVGEYLQLFAAAYKVPKGQRSARVSELLDQARLKEFAHKPVHVLSRGQKQRLNLMRSLIHRPEVLLLDEPASGLDPRSRVELRDHLRSLAAEGVAVLVSSHVLSDLEEVADRVVFVDRGVTVGEEQLSALSHSSKRTWRVRAIDNDQLVTALIEHGYQWVGAGNAGVDVSVGGDAEAAQMISRLVSSGVALIAVAPGRGALESAYLQLTEDQK